MITGKMKKILIASIKEYYSCPICKRCYETYSGCTNHMGLDHNKEDFYNWIKTIGDYE